MGWRPATASSSRTARPASTRRRPPECASSPSPAARHAGHRRRSRPESPALVPTRMLRRHARSCRHWCVCSASCRRPAPACSAPSTSAPAARAPASSTATGTPARPRRAPDRACNRPKPTTPSTIPRRSGHAVCARCQRRALPRPASPAESDRRHRLRRHLLAGRARRRRRPVTRLDHRRDALGHDRLARPPRASPRPTNAPPRGHRVLDYHRRRHVAGDADAQADVAEAAPARDLGAAGYLFDLADFLTWRATGSPAPLAMHADLQMDLSRRMRRRLAARLPRRRRPRRPARARQPARTRQPGRRRPRAADRRGGGASSASPPRLPRRRRR